MCRMIGFVASHRTRLDCALVEAQNSLLVQSREDLTGFSHADGWGIAYYNDPGLPTIVRHPDAAHQGRDYREAARLVQARCVISHVRRATVGEISLENTHPFNHGPWSFAHNGTVAYFQECVRDRMLETMSEEHREAIKGSTDSETLFHFILSKMDEQPDGARLDVLTGALRDVINWCHDCGPTPKIGLNVMLTDGKHLMGSRWLRSLYHIERRGLFDCELCGTPHAEASPPEDYRATVIASEPVTGEPWQEVPERSAYEVLEGPHIAIRPLER